MTHCSTTVAGAAARGVQAASNGRDPLRFCVSISGHPLRVEIHVSNAEPIRTAIVVANLAASCVRAWRGQVTSTQGSDTVHRSKIAGPGYQLTVVGTVARNIRKVIARHAFIPQPGHAATRKSRRTTQASADIVAAIVDKHRFKRTADQDCDWDDTHVGTSYGEPSRYLVKHKCLSLLTSRIGSDAIV